MGRNSRIFVANFGPDMDNSALWGLFEPFGRIVDVNVVRDKQTKRCLGYGFVQFVNPTDAAKAIAGANGLKFGFRKLDVKAATPRPERYADPRALAR